MSRDIHERLANLPGFPVLAGARVCLRRPCEGDIDAVFALFSDPAVARHRGGALMRARTQAAGRIAESIEAFMRRDRIDWLIADRREGGAIGSCTLFDFDARQGRAGIGYALRSDAWGRGLATEAVTLALGWGFRALGLQCIRADIDPRNDASRRLLLRLGFRSTGIPRDRPAADTDHTVEVFGLSAPDWRPPAR